MRYMFLIYTQPGRELAPEEREQMKARACAVMEEAYQRGIFRGAEPLAPIATATTVRKQDGKVLMTDGPFAETKEQLGGYYILDCRDLDEALEWAAKIPVCGGAGCVEVRPLQALPQPGTAEFVGFVRQLSVAR